MKSSHARKDRRLTVETLETRQLMAGDVKVAFNSGDVVITGDNASNSVEIYQTSLDTYKVIGRTAGNSATKINGRVGGSFTFTLNGGKFTDDIIVNMNGGDDRINIHGSSAEYYDIDAHDEIFINMGSGNDEVRLENVETGGDLVIDLGTGRDSIWAGPLDIGDDLIVTKSGKSGAIVDSAAIVFGETFVHDDFKITLNNSVDTVNIVNSAADDLFVSLGNGNDALNINKSRARRTSLLDGGSGDDRLNLFGNYTSFKTTSFRNPTAINQEFLY